VSSTLELDAIANGTCEHYIGKSLAGITAFIGLGSGVRYIVPRSVICCVIRIPWVPIGSGLRCMRGDCLLTRHENFTTLPLTFAIIIRVYLFTKKSLVCLDTNMQDMTS
jgi:hypothetical protein